MGGAGGLAGGEGRARRRLRERRARAVRVDVLGRPVPERRGRLAVRSGDQQEQQSAHHLPPRNVGLRADDAVASHRAADGTGRSMKRARTYAHGISRGAVARSLYPSRSATKAPQESAAGRQ